MLVYYGSSGVVLGPNIDEMYFETFDFGFGFYVYTDKNLAEIDAKHRGKLMQQKYGVITCYDLNESMLRRVKVKKFKTTSKVWMNLVINNRTYVLLDSEYDVILGKKANETFVLNINMLCFNWLTKKQIYKNVSKLTDNHDQICITNNDALGLLLSYKGYELVNV
jgi:hypothetical protein